jgi:FkbM family methyltransferase
MLFDYIRKKLARKKARRVFSEYPIEVDSYNLPQEGKVDFANWRNPLLAPKVITQSEVNFFKQFVPKGSLAIDIGGNTGDTTVPMGLAAGTEGLVLGFDPNPHVFKVLESNAGLNKEKTNITVFPFGIADQDGEFYFSSSEASFSNGGLTKEQSKYHGSFTLSQKVKAVNLEQFLDKNYSNWLNKLAFIKIDTEGLDKEIIKSIAGLIRRTKPVIISEVFTKLSKAEREELYDSVAQHGYKLHYFHDFEEGTQAHLISREDMMKWKHFNFYAIPS